jgi:hypothetical protein
MTRRGRSESPAPQEGRIAGAAGRLYASAKSTLLVFDRKN